jgi:endonuclease/exonuclease/phosphatase (EEP) superfamily protein YafD
LFRIVAWNANGGLAECDAPSRKRAKAEYLWALKPDLAFVPEYGCGHPDQTALGRSVCFVSRHPQAKSGRPNGLAISSRRGRLTRYASSSEHAYLACYWELETVEIRVLAIHSQAHKYCSNVIESLKEMRTWLSAAPCIVAGDLNTNPALKAGDNSRKFGLLWAGLGEMGLASAWHTLRGCSPQGEDPPTLCRRRDDHCRMIDYVLFDRTRFEVKAAEVVTERPPSDHRAVIADLVLVPGTEGSPQPLL